MTRLVHLGTLVLPAILHDVAWAHGACHLKFPCHVHIHQLGLPVTAYMNQQVTIAKNNIYAVSSCKGTASLWGTIAPGCCLWPGCQGRRWLLQLQCRKPLSNTA